MHHEKNRYANTGSPPLTTTTEPKPCVPKREVFILKGADAACGVLDTAEVKKVKMAASVGLFWPSRGFNLTLNCSCFWLSPVFCQLPKHGKTLTAALFIF